MPKFTEHEKEQILQSLLSNGKELFSQYGLSKTSIDQIVNACGIAKGSFYKFFSSKEELYLAILKNEEHIRDHLLSELLRDDLPPKALLSAFLHKAYRMVEDNPFLQSVFQPGEYERIVRKLPRHVKSSARADNEKGVDVINALISRGLLQGESPAIIVGIMRAIMMLRLHKEQIGPEIFPQVIDKLIDYTAEGLTKGKQKGGM